MEDLARKAEYGTCGSGSECVNPSPRLRPTRFSPEDSQSWKTGVCSYCRDAGIRASVAPTVSGDLRLDFEAIDAAILASDEAVAGNDDDYDSFDPEKYEDQLSGDHDGQETDDEGFADPDAAGGAGAISEAETEGEDPVASQDSLPAETSPQKSDQLRQMLAAESPKRRPGRPRKEVSETEAKTKRPVGRPRKTAPEQKLPSSPGGTEQAHTGDAQKPKDSRVDTTEPPLLRPSLSFGRGLFARIMSTKVEEDDLIDGVDYQGDPSRRAGIVGGLKGVVGIAGDVSSASFRIGLGLTLAAASAAAVALTVVGSPLFAAVLGASNVRKMVGTGVKVFASACAHLIRPFVDGRGVAASSVVLSAIGATGALPGASLAGFGAATVGIGLMSSLAVYGAVRGFVGRGWSASLSRKLHRNWTDTSLMSPKEVKALNDEFERAVSFLFAELNYKVKLNGTQRAVKNGLVKSSGDTGVDIFLEDAAGRQYVVDCKRYGKPAGEDEVIKIIYVAARRYQGAVPVVVSTSGFTSGARKLAKKEGVLLVDYRSLLRKTKFFSGTGTPQFR